MKVDDEKIRRLRKAISDYDFPMVVYDFQKQSEKSGFGSYRTLEQYIRDMLVSDRNDAIKNGLSNVLYWGYATTPGLQRVRIQRFRSQVTDHQLSAFSRIIGAASSIGLSDVSKCELPQFSNLSFISKVLMFIDPSQYVTLDLQLSKIKKSEVSTCFRYLKVCPTYLPVNEQNQKFYSSWCKTCAELAQEYFYSDGARAVDVERGLFTLVRNNETDFAASLLNQAAA